MFLFEACARVQDREARGESVPLEHVGLGEPVVGVVRGEREGVERGLLRVAGVVGHDELVDAVGVEVEELRRVDGAELIVDEH